ncbi:MAG: arylsulfatase [Planctomycetes bacterium]|nr:arylsulfatase [Planctomycetota bacterium]
MITAASVLPATAAQPPNIVFILADDMGIGDAGCYNAESKIPTPNIDRLAAEGMRFTDAHSPSAVCSPTRYGVLTGRYAWRSRLKSGVLWGYSRSLIEPERLTVAGLLKNEGYRTACIGKWHLGFQSADIAKKGLTDDSPDMTADHPHAVDYSTLLRPGPMTVGFDYFFGIPASLDMYPHLYVENDRPVTPLSTVLAGSKSRRQGGEGFWRAGPAAPGFHPVEVLPTLADKAVDWITSQSVDQPFFLYFPLSAPHKPWVPATEFAGRSQAGYYGDFVAQVDSVVGRVMDVLDEHGLSDNTLLIFTSDNGAQWVATDIKQYNHRANLRLRGQKADIWEGGHRVPFVARLPRLAAPGSTCDQTICLTDLMATAAALTKAELPHDAAEDSFSFLTLLQGKPESTRKTTVHHSLRGTFAIRAGRWKLIEGNLGSGGFSHPNTVEPEPDGPQGQLYDLVADPREETNLYAQKPEVVARLSAELKQIRKEGRSMSLAD